MISHINITIEQIVASMKKYTTNKAVGCDDLSVAMLQLCPSEIVSPLTIIFNKCVSFPILGSLQPIHKIGNRQLVSSYMPISLLCGKILEKIIFVFLNTNNLISKNQSRFRPGDSTIYQLISITSNIYESFKNFDETCAFFVDISKAFDKVWHDGIICKLKCNDISGNVLNFFENYLHNRYQHVVLNGTTSNWRRINADVPQ